VGTIENSAAFLKQKSQQFKTALATTASNTGAIVDNLLKLTFLYTSIFLIQVLLLPLAVFWFLLRMSNALMIRDLTLQPPLPTIGIAGGSTEKKPMES